MGTTEQEKNAAENFGLLLLAPLGDPDSSETLKAFLADVACFYVSQRMHSDV